jgi:pimeloyl-ACP methyl ester carboxylesterase
MEGRSLRRTAHLGLLSLGMACSTGKSDTQIVALEATATETTAAPAFEMPTRPDPEPEPVEEPERCPEGPVPVPESAFIAMNGALSTLLDPCTGATHATAGPEGARLRVRLQSWDGDEAALVWVEDLLGNAIAGPQEMWGGDDLELDLQQAGEVLVVVEPTLPDPERRTPYSVGVSCLSGCDRAFTRYPMVLMHGMAGSDAWLDVVDYFVDVENTLAEAGYIGIAPGVDAFNSVENRALQWEAHLDELQAQGIGRRFNLIGHSQGGLDARYLASVLEDDRIVSIVTVGTPHRGTPLADLGIGVLEGVPGLSWAVDASIDVFAQLVGLGDAEFTAQIEGLSQPAAEAFNAAVPDVEGIYMASWAGRTCSRVDLACRADNDNEIADTVFDLTTTILDQVIGDNDGLVPVESAIWGDFQGVLPADHIDQVGLTDPLTTAPLDHRAFYRDEAERLRRLGF